MINKIILVILFGLSVSLGYGQINIQEDYMIERMMSKYVELNQAHPNTAGWRIQVLASTDRRKVETAYAKFQENFPGMTCDWKQESPYYKLRAGAFLTKLEAIAAREAIKRYYRTAFPAYDKNINIQEFFN